jgi:hypothetical protein
MISADSYLHVPEGYGRWLGGLRWSVGGEAVEFPDGQTFAFGRELSLFLDGFASGRELIHFGHVLHLVHLLLRGPLHHDVVMPMDLAGGFAILGRPHRNAGAFCATLCQAVPGLPDPPDVEAVCLLLTAGAAVGGYHPAQGDPDLVLWGGYDPFDSRDWPAVGVDDPPMAPAAFERLVLERLAQHSPEHVRHWLRLGRGPEPSGRSVADRVEAELPGTFREALEPLLDRPRLSGSSGLLDRLAGALALPPRRLARESLPTGGYADVSNRGDLGRLLPGQHAMEPEEFLRRFAENELLYYHREEPHAPESEELVVLVDQGVRTWGGVRPVLAAAAVALGRLADRRGVAMRLGASSDPAHRLLDPITTPADDLAVLLESSDLTPHPAPLLVSALGVGPARRRDLVLLTHPRSLEEPEVERAARRVGPSDRLFAVAVDDHRGVQLSEIRRGRPVTLARFRAESSDPPRLGPRPRPNPGAARGWEGDVEPIGFPFRVSPGGGPASGGDGPMFAFSGSGDWLAAIGPLGIPYAWRVDGSSSEVWPRGFSGGEVVRTVDAMLGVAGGFVVIGRLGDSDRPIAVHYDLNERVVRSYVKYLSDEPVWDWFYRRESHALIARGPDESWYVDLRTGGRFSSQDRCSSDVVASDLAAVEGVSVPPPNLLLLHDDDTRPLAGPSVRLRRETGTVTLDGVEPAWRPFRPFADGQPLLAGRRLERALSCGNSLAIYVAEGGRAPCWHLFRGPNPVLMPHHPAPGAGDLTLSEDGSLIAIRWAAQRYAVSEVDSPGAPDLLTPRGGGPGLSDVGLGRNWLGIQEKGYATLLRWDEGPLLVHSASGERAGASSSLFLGGGPNSPLISIARPGSLPAWASYDPRRFKATCRGLGLVAVVDELGHVALADSGGTLLCIVLASRGRLAVWMPDGTRFGPAELTGAPPTPGADLRIASALREATGRA